jgi:predicted ArsR family transcriptional regulator
VDAETHVEEIAKAVGVPMSEVRHHISTLAKKGVAATASPAGW